MKDQKTQEVIIQGFNAMRNDQKQIASKTSELQVDHSLSPRLEIT